MSITGERDDLPGGGPQKVGVAAADLMTGMYAATAILAALASRARTGRGQHIDLALLDTQVAWLANQAMNYLVGGEAPERAGNEHQNMVPYGVFETRDGHFALAIGNNSQLRKFCDVAGHPEIPDDPRFATNVARLQNRVELIATLNDITRQRTLDEWSAVLEPVGVPCGPINSIDRVFADPHVQARGMRVSVPHSLGVEVDYPANPDQVFGDTRRLSARGADAGRGLRHGSARLARPRRRGRGGAARGRHRPRLTPAPQSARVPRGAGLPILTPALSSPYPFPSIAGRSLRSLGSSASRREGEEKESRRRHLRSPSAFGGGGQGEVGTVRAAVIWQDRIVLWWCLDQPPPSTSRRKRPPNSSPSGAMPWPIPRLTCHCTGTSQAPSVTAASKSAPTGTRSSASP